MGLRDRLNDLTEPGSTVPQVGPRPPAGWEPGVRYQPDGSAVVTVPPTPALEGEADWESVVAGMGITVPDGFRVRLVEAKFDPAAWGRDDPDERYATTRPVWRYRFVVEVAPARIDVTELLDAVRPAESVPAATPADAPVFVFVAGDLQLGKPDGDGTPGTVQRFRDATARAVDRYTRLRAEGRAGAVLLPWVGDCIEGVNSQGGNLVARLDLTLTEMVRVYRRLVAEQVTAFAELCDDVTVAVVPGNHDEALRVGNQMASRYDDSWAIEGAAAAADVIDARGYKVDWVFPGRDELDLCIDAGGTRVGILHGHQTRGKMQGWLSAAALNRRPIGTADVVLSGHYHTLRLEHLGPTTWMQTGALDGGSTWWTHKGGLASPPAALTFLTSGGTWHGLEVV